MRSPESHNIIPTKVGLNYGAHKRPNGKKKTKAASHIPPQKQRILPQFLSNSGLVWKKCYRDLSLVRSLHTSSKKSYYWLPKSLTGLLAAHFLFTFSTYLERLESKLPKFAHWWDKPCWLFFFFLVIRTCLTRGNPCSSATNYLPPLRQALPHREEGTRTLLKAVSSECASKHICWTESDLFQRLCV